MSWTGSDSLDRLLELGYESPRCKAALEQTSGDVAAAALLLIDGAAAAAAASTNGADEPEPEPEPEPQQDSTQEPPEEGIPPGGQLVHTSTLQVSDYSGAEEVTMYHGTDSRAAQLIATSQRFRPSERGLLGRGVYVTRTRQKAHGYRVHHPGAGAVGRREHNLPLPNGRPDPGCILRFRVRLGVCKSFTRNHLADTFHEWHDEEVPQLAQTSSMKAAAAKAGIQRVCYNSAFSAGCSCCPKHGTDCPGSVGRGHHPPPGVPQCRGRCRCGFRICPRANTAFEEFAIYNPERIDRIEIVDGPAGLIGLGATFWAATPAVREAARREKEQEFAEWAARHPELCLESEQELQFIQSVVASQAQVAKMGLPAAAKAARDQFELMGGFLLETPIKSPESNGIYALVGFDGTDRWPHFQRVNSGNHMFFRPQTCEWVMTKTFDAHTISNPNQGLWHIGCEEGRLPEGNQNWRGWTGSRMPQSVVQATVTLVSASLVADAKAQVAAELQRMQVAVRSQIESISALVVSGSAATKANGTYSRCDDHNGWPHFVNEHGHHLFRHIPADAWRCSPTSDPKPTRDETTQIIAPDGLIPLASDSLMSTGKWCIFRSPHWHPEHTVRVHKVA
jgi:hypothetical protein